MNSSIRDLTGERFGRLVVESLNNGERKSRAKYWNCLCDCGTRKVVRGTSLTRKRTKSCGCYNIEKTSNRAKSHGLSKTSDYQLWFRIKQRCYSKNRENYKRYGGRGIKMFEAWINDPQSFIEYVRSLKNYGLEGFTIDRIENDGNYEPDNLRWASNKTQSRNKRSSVINLEIARDIKKRFATGNFSQTQISKDMGLSYHIVNSVILNKSWREA